MKANIIISERPSLYRSISEGTLSLVETQVAITAEPSPFEHGDVVFIKEVCDGGIDTGQWVRAAITRVVTERDGKPLDHYHLMVDLLDDSKQQSKLEQTHAQAANDYNAERERLMQPHVAEKVFPIAQVIATADRPATVAEIPTVQVSSASRKTALHEIAKTAPNP